MKAGGLDLLTLDSLYDEGAHRADQQAVYQPNPFEAMSNGVHVHPAVQMAQNQNNPFAPFQTQEQHFVMGPQNPFGDTAFPAYTQTTNPFGL